MIFKVFSLLMAIGFVTTALLGIQMGLQIQQRRMTVIWCLVAGIIVPVFVLGLD